MLAIIFALSILLTVLITALIRKIMIHASIIDQPKAGTRKIHKKPMPLGGGLAIFLSYSIIVYTTILVFKPLVAPSLHSIIIGLTIASALLMIIGIIDDKYNLPAYKQIWFPILAVLIVLGVNLHQYAGQTFFASLIDQDPANWLKPLFIVDLFAFCWLMGMMFTTKLLDGLDGLATGLVAIGALFIFFISQQEPWLDPDVAFLSITFAGCCIGFLVWNWHPANIFLGQGGSLFIGFMLGALALLSQGRIATTILVMGLPILDIVRVMIRRIQQKKSIFIGDKEHLHFKLLESGLNQRQAVLLFYAISLLFGITTFFLQSQQQLIALLFLLVLMLLIGIWFSVKEAK